MRRAPQGNRCESSKRQARTVRVQVDVVIHKGDSWGEASPVGQPARRAMASTEAGPENGLPEAKNATPGGKVGRLSPSSPAKVTNPGLFKIFVYPGGQTRALNVERLRNAVL